MQQPIGIPSLSINYRVLPIATEASWCLNVPMQRDMAAGFHRLSLEKANAAYEAGLAAQAAEWLARVPVEMRPPDLAGAVHNSLARIAASEGRWSEATSQMSSAVQAAPTDGFYQQRLALLRRRRALMDDQAWETMSAKIDPAVRLRPDDFTPELASVWACGAYYAWGSARAAPWSRYLRVSKSPPADPEERAAVFRLAAGYFCRFVAEQTGLLAVADVVVPIPADPDRYVARMASLPDELAKAVQAQLSIPAALFALQSTSSGIEMKRLPRAERAAAADEAYEPGPGQNLIAGRGVLVVDDLITSGSTLRSTAALLRDLGATIVVAAALNHAEG